MQNIGGYKCPLCQSEDNELIFSTTPKGETVHRVYSILRCRRDLLFFIHPRLQRQELYRFYPDDYEPYWKPLNEEPKWLLRMKRRRHFAFRCRAVNSANPEGGRLLDVGCATGGLLRQLCSDGRWQGVGVDINDYALAIAFRQGLRVLRGDAGHLGLSSSTFDSVTLWDVIEHVPDMPAMLAEIYRLLKPGATLLISTPNGGSWQARLWGRYWAGWDEPRHLQIFTPQTLRRLLEDKGFKVVRRLSFPMERFYFHASFGRWLQAHGHQRVRHPAQKLAGLIALGLWPLFRRMDYSGFASTIVLQCLRNG